MSLQMTRRQRGGGGIPEDVPADGGGDAYLNMNSMKFRIAARDTIVRVPTRPGFLRELGKGVGLFRAPQLNGASDPTQ